MRVGIIAEGRGDLAVITNILKGAIGLDGASIQYIRPEFYLDETDMATMNERQFSSWTLVKNDCCELNQIVDFLEAPIDEQRLLIIQIDTAEADNDGYEANRPLEKDHKRYSSLLRENVVAKINEWTNGYSTENICFAVAVEEIDAWVLTIYMGEGDTCQHRTPKEKLRKELPKKLSPKETKKLSNMKAFDYYWELTRNFRKKKELEKCTKKNHSLYLFCESLIDKVSTLST